MAERVFFFLINFVSFQGMVNETTLRFHFTSDTLTMVKNIQR